MSATDFITLLSADPFLLYTLIAALFLGFVSLWSGVRRKDFLTLVNPQGLLHLALAVLLAFILTLLSGYLETLSPDRAQSGLPWLESLRGLSRFPLYVVALAYGPSTGLVAAGLFAAFATTTALPGWPEAILALELVVLGWFAVAPSPRRYRWAGPFNALMAYFLAWATGGSAMLQALTGEGTAWATHATYHAPLVVGAGLSAGLLIFIGPRAYRTLFPGSRIAPRMGAPDPAEQRAVVPRRTGRKNAPTFGSLWGNEDTVSSTSQGRWQLTFTPPELEGELLGPRTQRRSLDELSLEELRSEPRRRHTDTNLPDVAQLKRTERLPRDLEPPPLEDV